MACETPYQVQSSKRWKGKVDVPCGRCPSCKFRRVNEWVFRLQQQEGVSASSHFVTLTYDTTSVPISPNGFMTLSSQDLRNYFKRLRKRCPGADIKYYAVGEYGTKTQRPHYHSIVFNVPDPNAFFEAWHLNSRPLGTIHVGTVTSDSIAYTLKYIDKPNFVKRHARDDRTPQFARSSKNLGSCYINSQTLQYHRASLEHSYLTKLDGFKVAMPRYYRTKIWSEAERSAQIDFIQTRLQEAETYARKHHDLVMPYDDFLDSRRIHRYRKFYKQKRDLL